MSGLEVIGVVASIIQIADLGAKLSVKLCTFYKAVKVANKSMQELSSDVSLTCSILNELGKTLEQDDQTRLCSKQAFFTAQEVLQECKSVFEEIDTAIEKHSQDNEKNRLMRHARKITIALLGPDLNVLKSNLERLKSTTLLMLHVIMYAGQLRKENEKSTMADQRGLIQTLLEEKIANDAKYDTLSKSIQAVSISKDDSAFQPSFKALSIDPQPTPSTPLWNEVGEYYNLVRGLLCQIDAYQDTLEKSRHLRIRNGVINVHSAESVLFQHIHGHAANQLFDDPIFRFRDASFPATHQIHTRSDSTDETAKRGKTRPELSHSSDSEYEPEREKTGKSYVHRERRRDPDKTRGSAESRIDPSEDNLSDFTSYEDCCLTAPALHKRPGFRRARRGSATISRYERGVGDEPLARRDFDESDYYDLPPAYINSHKSEFEERRAEAENGFRRHPHDGIHSHFDHRSWPDPRPDDSIAQAPQLRKKKKRYRHCGSDDSKICIDTDKKREEDQPMLPPPPQPIKSSSDDGDHDDDILIIDEVTDLIGKPIESKEENWDSSPYVSSEPAPDIITLESLVLQWTTLKPEELLRLDATWRRKEEERYDMNL